MQMRILTAKSLFYQVVLWMTFGVGLLAISKVLTANPTIWIVLIAVLLTAAFLITEHRSWLWLTILMIFSNDVFGIFSGMALPHISLPGLGTMYISDLLLVVAALHAVYRLLSTRNGKGRITPIGRPLLALVVLVGFEAVRNLIGGLDIHTLLNGLRPVAYYLLFLIVLTEIQKPEQLRRFLLGLLVVAIISSIVSYMQFLFGVTLPGSKVEVLSGAGLYRIYPAGWCLINSSFLVLLAVLLSGATKGLRSTTGWLVAIILLGAITVTFARSTWGTMLIAITVLVFLSRRYAWRRFPIAIAFVVLFIFVGNKVFQSVAGVGLNVLVQRAGSGIEDFWGRSGTFGARLNFITFKWAAITKYNPLFGRGFDLVRMSGAENWRVNWTPFAQSADNGIVNIFLIFGYLGIGLFSWIFVAVFRRAVELIRKLNPCLDRALVIGIMAFNFQLLLESFFGDRFTWYPAVAVLATSWAVLELIGRFHERKAVLVTEGAG